MSHTEQFSVEKAVSFSRLRDVYRLVKELLEAETGGQINSLDDKIGEVLGIDGDDVEELLVKFVDRYGLNWGTFNFSDHFYSEGELFSSSAALINIWIFAILLISWTLEIVSCQMIKIKHKPEFYRPDRIVSDLTFRQMITWCLEGEFKQNARVIYQLA